jgi:hypothetical protein
VSISLHRQSVIADEVEQPHNGGRAVGIDMPGAIFLPIGGESTWFQKAAISCESRLPAGNAR